MTDHAIRADEEDGEFRSPTNLALDGAGVETFKWLVIGHVLFAIGLIVALAAGVGRPGLWLTPLFGLPLLWRTRDSRFWQKAAALLIGFAAAHYLAAEAVAQYRQQDAWVQGLAGGAVGAAVSLAICSVLGLLRGSVATLVFVVFGVVVLALIGSMGVYLFQTTGTTGEGLLSDWAQMLKIYTPWQVVFAFVLAHTLRPDG